MEMRQFGATGMRLSLLGFGCGAVGGLMVRGAARERLRTIARAREAGVNYFDTAVQYGDGLSETHLGQALGELGATDAVVGTKVRIPPAAYGQIAAHITASLEASLRRLGRDCVDIFHLHNPITDAGGGATLSPEQVLQEVLPNFEALRQAGKTRFLGITAVGDTSAILAVLASGRIDSAQVVYNLLNPSAGAALPAGYPGQDYAAILNSGVGAIGIRVLAGGALSGTAERHPIASPAPEPIGSALEYADDLARAGRFAALVEEGHAGSLAEAATRFAISHPGMGTILVGMATPEQFEQALSAVLRGPLPEAALARVRTIQAGFVGETR
ncbi:MAG: aldo/keto reductase [Rhodospirillales bacterium]|nr:aldo/keto reductase [Rhodospirillales bacterium]